MAESREQKFTPGENLGYFLLTRLKPEELVLEDSKTFQEVIGSEDFQELAPKLLEDFAVSGVWSRGGKVLKSFTDLDGKVSLGLLQLAGFDISKTEYVRPGESKIGFLNIDTGGRNGVVVEGDVFKDELSKITAWCDNHGEESARGSSSAEFMYEALTELKLLEKDSTLDKIIDFNQRVEAGNFDWTKEYWRSHKTLIGLNRFMNFKQVCDFFLSGKNFEDEVTEKQLERWSQDDFLPPSMLKRKQEGKPFKTIKDFQKELEEETIKPTRGIFESLEKDGLFISTSLGKILINPEGALRGGYAAAYAVGADGILSWSPKEESFMLSMKDKKMDIHFDQGILVRKQIYIKPAWVGQRMTISLREILEKIGYTGGISEKLRELLDQDLKEKRGVFYVSPVKKEKGYTTSIDGVFSVFPRGWEPKKLTGKVPVRVRAIIKRKEKKDFYALEPVQNK